MPDRYGEQLDHHSDVSDAMWAAQQRREAIEECDLCDYDGYVVGSRVCDHVDHRPAAIRGRKLIDAELQKIRDRKGQDQ